MEKPQGLDEEDGKFSYCLACRNKLNSSLGTSVIVCDRCPAAFHAQCAGYGTFAVGAEGLPYVSGGCTQSAGPVCFTWCSQPLCTAAASVKDVPEGEWLCWACSKDGSKFLFPTSQVSKP